MEDLDFTRPARQPRSATAMARTPCRVIALDAKQFQRAVQATPQFVLMSIMINRLRLTDAMLGMTRSLPEWGAKGESRVLHELASEPPRLVAARACQSV